VPQPTPDCETIGKPRTMTFRYTGGGCSATHHDQDPSKVSCQDLGSLTGPVQVVYTGSNASHFTVTPAGEVIQVGDEVTISTSDDRFPAQSYVEIRKGGVAVEKLSFHTSCSQPLHVGDQFGSLLVLGWNGVTGGGSEVTYTYVIRNHGSRVVDVTLSDDKLGTIDTGLTLEMGETRMYTRTASITATTTNVATVSGHLLDANGPPCTKSAAATVTVAPPPVTCEDGKPRSLVFEYTGEGCGASNNQQGTKAKCTDVSSLGSAPVQVVLVSNAADYTVIPSGEVLNPGDRVTISATGRDRFDANTALEIRRGGQALQKLEIHTSCSQPLNIGDQFGSLILREFHITLLTAMTPVGNEVAVDLGGDVQLQFAQVMEPGTTLLTYGPMVENLPAGLVAVMGEAVQLSTTAHFGGTIEVALRYDEGLLASPEEMVKLLHHDGSGWREITTGVDAAHNMVVGSCEGLSTFVVAAPVAALAADEPVAVGLEYGLKGSYPNPTTGRTTIRYVLTRSGAVRLTVHDVQGRQVAVLEAGERGAGEHRAVWSGRSADGRKLSAGIYLVRLESVEGLRTAKLVMME